MKITNILILLIVLSGTLVLKAQTILLKEMAVSQALENNFGIQLSEAASDIASNNTSIYNSGKLPTVALNGGYNFSLDNTIANFQDGRTTTLTFAPSQGFNASVGANYVIFDGFFRQYNTQQLQERYSLSLLEVKAAMENVAAQTLSQYYQIATISSNLNLIKELIGISTERLDRANQRFEFGQASQLEILNAIVDLNNDSLNYINTSLQLQNAKRLLNNLTVVNQDMNYDVEREVAFIEGLNKEFLRNRALEENIALAQINKNIEIGNIAIDMSNARKLPTVGANLSYGYSYSKNNSASFLASATNHGLSGGLSVTWNIFDGGSTRHSVQNAKLNNIQLALQREQLIENLGFEFDNAWANYENRLHIYNTQLDNVAISRENFLRSQERFNIGQITSVDFRQAQLNLLNAETTLISAKYEVKISEVELLLLSGQILN